MTQNYLIHILTLRISYYNNIVNQYVDNLRAVRVNQHDIDELMAMTYRSNQFDWIVDKYANKYERFADDASELIDIHYLVLRLCETLQFTQSKYFTPDEVWETNCDVCDLLGINLDESTTIH